MSLLRACARSNKKDLLLQVIRFLLMQDLVPKQRIINDTVMMFLFDGKQWTHIPFRHTTSFFSTQNISRHKTTNNIADAQTSGAVLVVNPLNLVEQPQTVLRHAPVLLSFGVRIVLMNECLQLSDTIWKMHEKPLSITGG